MVTKTGMQSNLLDAIYDLIELDLDAIEAYKVAINNLQRPEFKSKLNEFMHDHKNHVRDLSGFLRKQGKKPPLEPSTKQWLTKGKVVLANIFGDNAIIKAMISNEEDTNTAYERMCHRDDLNTECKNILTSGLDDERRHKKWLEDNLQD
jgi:rubrerythrin